jgi:NifU-like protein involved in Fe-S cluster formation
MDEAVTKFYRGLLTRGFDNHFGAIDDASIYLDSHGERLSICGLDGGFLQLYISVTSDVIQEIKYKCSCDPVTNVAVEILIKLMTGKSLDEAAAVTEEAFGRFLGTGDDELRKKSKTLLELFNRGITRYRSRSS